MHRDANQSTAGLLVTMDKLVFSGKDQVGFDGESLRLSREREDLGGWCVMPIDFLRVSGGK